MALGVDSFQLNLASVHLYIQIFILDIRLNDSFREYSLE